MDHIIWFSIHELSYFDIYFYINIQVLRSQAYLFIWASSCCADGNGLIQLLVSAILLSLSLSISLLIQKGTIPYRKLLCPASRPLGTLLGYTSKLLNISGALEFLTTLFGEYSPNMGLLL